MIKRKYILSVNLNNNEGNFVGVNDDLKIFFVEVDQLSVSNKAEKIVKEVCLKNNINYEKISWNFFDTKIDVFVNNVENNKVFNNTKSEFIKELNNS
tara:strand:+ start:953 stop:1243 length:291 start_codon:yes stop_codon:yes gene_type:complete